MSISVSVGFADGAQIDMLGLWYIFVPVAGVYMQGHLEKTIQTPMAQGRST